MTPALLRRTNELAHRAIHPIGAQPYVGQHGDTWTVWQDTEGGPCMTLFSGPYAEWRARQYARMAFGGTWGEAEDLKVDLGGVVARIPFMPEPGSAA